MNRVLCMLLMVFFFSGCSEKPEEVVTIAINPWPGYEPLVLAEAKGFFETAGANIKLVQLDSLSDVQRAYLNGHVDGIASTMIEAVQASHMGSKPLRIVMVPDYSNGGDVIIGSAELTKLEDLKAKKIGAEVSSLGIFLLQKGLEKNNLTLDEVNVINLVQAEGMEKLTTGAVDAIVTYPPFSVDILKTGKYKILFSSAEIPNTIIDTISLSEESILANPKISQQLREAWQMALDYIQSNPEESYKLMAEREGITVEEFKGTLSDLIILSKEDQDKLFKENTQLRNAMSDVCMTLVQVNALETDCTQQKNMVLTY